MIATVLLSCLPAHDGPIAVGSRRELFVDRTLIAGLEGGALLRTHEPEAREVVLVTDKPWEGNTCAYYVLFEDEDSSGDPLFRMYYRGSHFDTESREHSKEYVCLATSRDGVSWERPQVGVVEFDGSTANNIVWDGVGSHNFTVFKDANPDCPEDERYKALGSGMIGDKPVLHAFASPDGMRWRQIGTEPVITEGYFDSQNLAFWDERIGAYREYHRTFVDGVRAVMTGTSSDFRTWTEPELLTWAEGTPDEHLYTNAVLVYERAPHILLGFPTRYQPANTQVEPVLMASRDGRHFERWPEPLVPIDAPLERDGNRSNYMAWGVLSLPQSPDELSVYATEAYYVGPDSRLRRFAYRVDGFASLSAGERTGSLRTVPLSASSGQLRLNFETRGEGWVEVRTLDASSGEVLTRSGRLTGNATDLAVGGVRGAGPSRPILLEFELFSADVYSWRFED